MLFFLACLGCGWVGKAQSPYAQPIQFPYQIPTQVIYDMATDRQGMLYLGTDKGLFRFNGKYATAVAYEDARQLDITHLKEDGQGRLWGMNFAKQLFYLHQDTLRTLPVEIDDAAGAVVNFVFTQNQLWILTYTTLTSYDAKTFKRLFSFKYDNSLTQIASFENKVYIASEYKILVFEENHSHIEEQSPTGFHVTFQIVGETLYVMQNRDITPSKERVFLKWQNGKRTQLPTIDLPADTYVNHYTATAQQLWVCARRGGYTVDAKTGKTHLLFPNKNVTDVVQDYQGNYWVSTLNDGLWFCPSLQNIEYPLPIDLRLHTELSCITLFEGHLYFGTTEGKVLKVAAQALPTATWETLCKASNSEIRRLRFDRNHRVFATGLGLFDMEGKELARAPLIKDACFYNHDGQVFLLIATSYGLRLCKIYPPKQVSAYLQGFKLDTLNKQNKTLHAYNNHRIQRSYSTAVDVSKQRFWIGYDNGLVMYDFAGKATPIYDSQKKVIIAHSLAVDTQGRLWVGTFQQGLFVIEDERTVGHLQAGKALKNNHIYKIIVDKDKIWLGTQAEIGYVDAQTLEFTDVLAQSGLSSSLAYKDFYPDAQGIWVALSHSVLYVPNSPNDRKEELRLLPLASLDANTFAAEALHYKNPSKVQIKYRLKGIDQEWQTIGEPYASIHYPHLRKGNYTLEVFAQDAITKLKSAIQTLPFTVPTQWWETWWFLSSTFVAILGVIGSIAYVIIERNRQKQLFKEQLWISQIKALQSQMNPHFLYNILNTVQGLVYSDRRSEASDVLGNFSDLMRNTLQISEKPYITLNEEVELLKLYVSLEKIRFEEAIDCHITVDFPTETWRHHIPSMLLQPFVENAFKHGLLHKRGDKRLHIIFSRQGDNLQVVIEDNGIGREYAQEIQKRQARKSTGFALSATQQRVALLNKIHPHQIHIDIIDQYNGQQEATGTKVVIIFHFTTI